MTSADEDDPYQKREYEIELEKLERSRNVKPSTLVKPELHPVATASGAAAMEKPHFAELPALRVRLVEKSGHGGHESVEARLVALIDAVEATWQRAETEYDWGTYSDKHADMQNLAGLQKQIEETARTIEAACRHRLSYYRW